MIEKKSEILNKNPRDKLLIKNLVHFFLGNYENTIL